MVLTCFILRKVKETYGIFNQPTICPRHAMTTANCYLHSLRRNFSVNVSRVRLKVVFPARSNQTPWKKPNTIYIFNEICHFRGIPSFNSIMHNTINDSSSHTTSHLPLSTSPLGIVFSFHSVTCHSHLGNSGKNLVWKPLKKVQVTSVNTHYANTKFLCDLFTVYSNKKNKTSNFSLYIFLKEQERKQLDISWLLWIKATVKTSLIRLGHDDKLSLNKLYSVLYALPLRGQNLQSHILPGWLLFLLVGCLLLYLVIFFEGGQFRQKED